jgi:hypothetical protein
MKMTRLQDEIEERLEQDRIERMRSDLVQRIQGANGERCPLQAERRESVVLAPETAYYARGEEYRTHADGCCMLQNKLSGTEQCYIARGHTTAKEACPVYQRVLGQLGL